MCIRDSHRIELFLQLLSVLLDLLGFFERFCQLTEVGETESSHAKEEGLARLGRSSLGVSEAAKAHHFGV